MLILKYPGKKGEGSLNNVKYFWQSNFGLNAGQQRGHWKYQAPSIFNFACLRLQVSLLPRSRENIKWPTITCCLASVDTDFYRAALIKFFFFNSRKSTICFKDTILFSLMSYLSAQSKFTFVWVIFSRTKINTCMLFKHIKTWNFVQSWEDLLLKEHLVR